MLNKAQSSERIKFAEEDDSLITNKEKLATKLNDYFSNAVIKLEISKLKNFNPLSENIDNPTLKAIVKYRKHPSITAIGSEVTNEHFL